MTTDIDQLTIFRTSLMIPNIRLATMDDIPALRELITASVKVLGTQYYTLNQISSALSHVFGVDSQLILDKTYFVAEVKSEIAGSGGWSKRETLFGGDQLKARVSDSLLDPATDAARIRAFYVHPRWSRKGVASRILQSCENAAREDGFHSVELLATLPGLPFYIARGYETTEGLVINTPDGESLPAFRMKKSLNLPDHIQHD